MAAAAAAVRSASEEIDRRRSGGSAAATKKRRGGGDEDGGQLGAMDEDAYMKLRPRKDGLGAAKQLKKIQEFRNPAPAPARKPQSNKGRSGAAEAAAAEEDVGWGEEEEQQQPRGFGAKTKTKGKGKGKGRGGGGRQQGGGGGSQMDQVMKRLSKLELFAKAAAPELVLLKTEYRREMKSENVMLEIEMLSPILVTMASTKRTYISRMPDNSETKDGEWIRHPEWPKELRHVCWGQFWDSVIQLISFKVNQRCLESTKEYLETEAKSAAEADKEITVEDAKTAIANLIRSLKDLPDRHLHKFYSFPLPEVPENEEEDEEDGDGDEGKDDEDASTSVDGVTWKWVIKIDRVATAGKNARAALNKLRLMESLSPLGISFREDRAPKSKNEKTIEQYAYPRRGKK